jgi:thioesterase domain-containing protein
MVALLPHGIDGTPVPRTIEAMAADYIELIRVRQPRGPYRIGGLCNGGLIAYEMARQLAQAGERVETLIMIEPPDWNLPRLVRVVRRLAMRSDVFRPVLERLYAMRPRLRYYRRKLKAFRGAPFREKLRLVARKVWSRQPLPDSARAIPTVASVKGAVPVLDELPGVYVEAIKLYRPGAYGGPMLYVATEEELAAGTIDPRLWRSIAADMALDILPGNHRSVVTRFVAELSRVIDERLTLATK